MQPFCQKIYRVLIDIVDVYQYIGHELEITGMWGNIQKPNTYFKHHTHYNNIFSGVFYLNENEDFPDITFWRSEETSFDPKRVEFNPFNRGSWFERTEKDKLIVFPAWLQHSVDLNKTNEDRISIAFNAILKGDYYNVTI